MPPDSDSPIPLQERWLLKNDGKSFEHMKRAELEHVIRASGAIVNEDELILHNEALGGTDFHVVPNFLLKTIPDLIE